MHIYIVGYKFRLNCVPISASKLSLASKREPERNSIVRFFLPNMALSTVLCTCMGLIYR